MYTALVDAVPRNTLKISITVFSYSFLEQTFVLFLSIYS